MNTNFLNFVDMTRRRNRTQVCIVPENVWNQCSQKRYKNNNF